MLQGVEILSQKVVPITEPNNFILVFGWIIAIILFIAITIKVDATLGVSIFFLIFTISFGLSNCILQKTSDYTQYKVTISEEVNFVEFNEKYEIISQDGKIYTIKERVD